MTASGNWASRPPPAPHRQPEIRPPLQGPGPGAGSGVPRPPAGRRRGPASPGISGRLHPPGRRRGGAGGVRPAPGPLPCSPPCPGPPAPGTGPGPGPPAQPPGPGLPSVDPSQGRSRDPAAPGGAHRHHRGPVQPLRRRRPGLRGRQPRAPRRPKYPGTRGPGPGLPFTAPTSTTSAGPRLSWKQPGPASWSTTPPP